MPYLKNDYPEIAGRAEIFVGRLYFGRADRSVIESLTSDSNAFCVPVSPYLLVNRFDLVAKEIFAWVDHNHRLLGSISGKVDFFSRLDSCAFRMVTIFSTGTQP